MTDQQIFAKIKDILIAYLPKESNDKLTESTHLIDDLGINSARLIDIVLELEDKFGISINDTAIDKMTTIGDAIQIVSSLVADFKQPSGQTAGTN